MRSSSTARRALSPLARRLPAPVRDAIRPLLRRAGLAAPEGAWEESLTAPWSPPTDDEALAPVWCNVCRWTGATFEGIAHSESANCPRCGSIARDRFLLWCCFTRIPSPGGMRVLETSPRLGTAYRERMRRWFDYRASDFDLSAHAGDIQLDLQDIRLDDGSIDLVITPHVLEHVPDTVRALSELHRVIASGGRMYLQVPLVYGTTRAPTEPEFHADNTPVFWNFGWDIIELLRDAGFEADLLVTDAYRRMLTGVDPNPGPNGDGFHLDTLVPYPRPADLVGVANDEEARRLSFEPSYHFATWECRRP